MPTCAIIGMAAMVGGGTGAAMTAVTMIFEMTRDYDLVMPSIVAVALAIGVRRLLSPENIYTIKLVGRGHMIPKALHANMFLIRRAGEVMERDVCVVPADADFDAFLRQHGSAGNEARRRHAGQSLAGVVRVNTNLRRGIEAAYSGISLGAVAQRNFTLARENDIVFDIVQRMARHNASMAVVTKTGGRWRPSEIIGVISKEHIANSVAESIKPFGPSPDRGRQVLFGPQPDKCKRRGPKTAPFFYWVIARSEATKQSSVRIPQTGFLRLARNDD